MLPEGIKNMMRRLRQAGQQVYLVGGCVRDMLLGRPVHDWDLTTDALPERVMELFDRVIPTGLAHGTVTVFYAGAQAEITTFRTESGYQDGRHPGSVAFVGELREDLRRRDFTINAMAMDETGAIYDYFGGRDDLCRRRIVCVGRPEERFSEDALRMFRAFRFSAQLGFAVEPQTYWAAVQNHKLAYRLSVERIRDELEKTICSPRPRRVEQMAQAGLLERFGVAGDVDASLLERVPAEPVVRWSAAMVCMPPLMEAELRLDRRTKRIASRAAACGAQPCTRLRLKRLLACEGPEVAAVYAALQGASAQLAEVLQSGECVSMAQLALRGSDLTGVTGREIGACLNRLLELVLEHPEWNRRDILMQKAAEILSRKD